MTDPARFTWRHFQPELILCAVRWSWRYALSDRDVEELLRERGVSVDDTTVCRWGQRAAPELDRCCRLLLRHTNASYPRDQTLSSAKIPSSSLWTLPLPTTIIARNNHFSQRDLSDDPSHAFDASPRTVHISAVHA